MARWALVLTAIAAAAAIAFLVSREGDETTSPSGSRSAGTEVGEVSEPPGEEAVRLAGRPPPPESASLEALIGRLDSGAEGDGPVREEIARRARESGDVLSRLLELLTWEPERLSELGLYPYAVFEALVAVGRPAAEPLARLALDTSQGRTPAVFVCLERLGADAAPAVPVLLGAWAGMTEPWMRQRAVQVLGSVGPEASEAVPLLTEIIRPPVDDALAGRAAAAVLAIAGCSDDVLAAYRQALRDEETLARPYLLGALSAQGEGAAALTDLLVELLEDPERETADAAALVLGEIGDPNERVLRALVRHLVDGGMGRRGSAAALAKLGEEGARLLLDTARGPEDVDVRLAAFTAYLSVRPAATEHADILLDVLDEDVDRGWQVRALWTVARMDPLPDEAVLLPYLKRALDKPRLAKAALGLLVRLPGEETRAVLLGRAKRADDSPTALAFIVALSMQDPESSVATRMWLDLFDEYDDEKSLMAQLQHASRIRPRPTGAEALPVIEPLLRHESRAVRLAAYTALASIRDADERVVDLLVAGVEAPDGALNGMAAWSLAKFEAHAARIVPVLVRRIAHWADQSGAIGGNLVWPLRKLGPLWVGTSAALDAALEAANDRGRPVLQSMREQWGL